MWIRLLVILLAVATTPRTSAAETTYVVIVNAKNSVRSVDRTTLTDLFLKKRTQWSGDVVSRPVDQVRGSMVRRQFSEQVLGRSVAAVRTYWNRLVFSGRGVPPPELATDEDVVKYVAKYGGAIGYVASSVDLKDSGVKVIEVR